MPSSRKRQFRVKFLDADLIITNDVLYQLSYSGAGRAF